MSDNDTGSRYAIFKPDEYWWFFGTVFVSGVCAGLIIGWAIWG